MGITKAIPAKSMISYDVTNPILAMLFRLPASIKRETDHPGKLEAWFYLRQTSGPFTEAPTYPTFRVWYESVHWHVKIKAVCFI